MIRISPIVRLAFGITILTVTLLLVLDFLGFMPNETRVTLDNRKVVAELLAVQVSAQVGQDQLDQVEKSLITLQARSEDVLSSGVRLASGRILSAAGDHQQHWQPLKGDRSTLTHVGVPIFEGETRWGTLEIVFVSPFDLFTGLFARGSLNLVVVLIGLAGFFVFWLFLKRALRELDPRSVVPERVNLALNVLAEGVVMVDRSERIVLVNEAFQKTVGRSDDSLMGSRLSDLKWRCVGDRDSTELDENRLPWTVILESNELRGAVQLELTTRFDDVLRFSVNAAPIASGDGSIRGAVVTFDDTTEIEKHNTKLIQAVAQLKISQLEIERKNNELEVLATRDPLTGALNRRSLFEAMGTLANEAKDLGTPLSCVMLDIDHFKSINDRFGHAAGDDIIKLLVSVLTETVDTNALVGRYGGEEFVVVLPETDEHEAMNIAEIMRIAVSNSESTVADTTIRISASFGVACDSSGRLSPGDLVDRADKALYKAKDSGRNRVVQYSLISQALAPENGNDPSVATDEAAGLIVPDAATLDDQNYKAETEHAKDYARNEHSGSGIVILDRLSQGIERSRRFGSHLAVLYIHIDALEVVSNTFGSAQADKMISEITSRMRNVLRASDTVLATNRSGRNISVSRVGVAELFVLLTDIKNSSDTPWIVKRISQALELPLEYNAAEISADMRMGISLYPGDSHNPQDLMANARSALRDAKNSEIRNSVLYFDVEMNIRSERQLNLEAQLQQALTRDELYLVYQPLINLGAGKLTGFETLVRWKNPQLGLVSPAQFIPIAEHSQLIVPIGRWIFDRTMRQLKQWRLDGHTGISVAVNFSAVQLRAEGFVDDVTSVIDQHGVPASAVTIEITESIIIEDVKAAVGILQQLQDRGFRIALDDFGTGYSSLSYLKDMPINVVKIDRSFFSDFPHNQRDTSIVSAIISLAHSLGINVVAEGVETEEQLAAIKQMQCDIVQGYVFSEPKSLEHTSALLEDSVQQRRFVRQLTDLDRNGGQTELSSVTGVISRFDEFNTGSRHR